MEKTLISEEQFEKKLEVEASYLMHFNSMDRNKARKVAREIVLEKFEVGVVA